MVGKLSALGFIFTFWLASKLSMILSPYNAWHELQCWSLQFADSWLIVFGIYSVREQYLACANRLVHEFPRGTDWETSEYHVELTPENMTQYFKSTPDALERPFIIRGYLQKTATGRDLTKFGDINFLKSKINTSHTYNFDAQGHAETLSMGEALDRMQRGDGLYMKFNRDFTNNEALVNEAVDAATDTLRQMGGDKVIHALRDNIKVTFLTYGEKMRTPIHNAMSANWFYQIVGTKDWKLWEPHQSIYLQAVNFPNAIASFSKFDSKFPNGPKYITFRTNPGDFLYFPSFWLHEVDNVGDGLKLAVGLRPGLSGTLEMWKTALIPFYENPKSTTALALMHVGPSVKIVADNIYSRLRLKYAMVVGGKSEADAKADFEIIDRERGRDWWVKSAYKNKELLKASGVEVKDDSDGDNF